MVKKENEKNRPLVLLEDLQRAKERAEREGWISDDEIQETMRE